MYEFTHDNHYFDEIYIRCTMHDEFGMKSTGISISRDALPELIAYLQTINMEKVPS